MCLAVPGQLVECDQTEAVVDLHGNRLRISTLLVPQVKVGDWVLVHAGFAIQTIDQQEAAETWAVLQDVRRAAEAQDLADAQQRPATSTDASGGGGR